MKFKVDKRKVLLLMGVLVVLFISPLLFFSRGTTTSVEDSTDLAQDKQCETLCKQIQDCSQEGLVEFELAGCTELYDCPKEADCTAIICQGNPPEELKQALGC